MIGIYFSGTGNTKHCVLKFLEAYDNGNKAYALEDKAAIEAVKAMQESDILVFG